MQTFGAFLVSFLATTGLAAVVPPKIGVPSATAPATSVDAVPNGNFVRHGPSALARTYIKYGKSVPPQVAAAVARNKQLWAARRDTGLGHNHPGAI